MIIRRIFGVTIALTAMLVVTAGTSNGVASSKFGSTEHVTATGDLVIGFEEMTLKRFEVVDYRLDATAIALLVSPCGTDQIVQLFPSATVAVAPDARGRVSGTLTLDLEVPVVTTCQVLRRVEYGDVTLTNLTTGRVYRLDPTSREFS